MRLWSSSVIAQSWVSSSPASMSRIATKRICPGDSEIRLAGMVGEDHRPLSLRDIERPDEEVLRDLDLRGPEPRSDSLESLSVEDTASLDRDELAGRDRCGREQASSLDRRLPDLRLRGEVGH